MIIVFQKLFKLDTCPILITALRENLHAWRKGYPEPKILEYSEILQEAIKEQRQLGWKQFIEGIISNKWKAYMETVYKNENSMRTGQRWSRLMTNYFWNAVMHIWDERNKKLHDTERVVDMSGKDILQKSIMAEWKIGLGRLPASEYSIKFKLHPKELFTKHIERQKQWLMIIRQGRILLDPEHLIVDEFSSSKTLQKWIGISYEMTDKEGKIILEEAITSEWNIGIGNLPKKHYYNLFSSPLNNILRQPLEKMKEWFRRVRQGREKYDHTNLCHDEFCNPGIIQDWIGF